MFKKTKIILISLALGLILVLFSTEGALAQFDNDIFYVSLNFQQILKGLISKILPLGNSDIYKEKYFKLLEELAKLKLSLEETKEEEIIQNLKNLKEKVSEAEVLKVDELGNIYIKNFQGIREGLIVVDKKWILIGKIVTIYKNYSIVESLLKPGIEFNTMDINEKMLGLGKTISNGFIEIDYVDPKTKIKEGDFVFTYGNDFFPRGFLIGEVSKIIKSEFKQKIIVKSASNFNSDILYIIK